MKFTGIVVAVGRHDHTDGPTGEEWERTMDVKIEGAVAGNGAVVEVVVPTSQARSYPVGRRVRVTVEPA